MTVTHDHITLIEQIFKDMIATHTSCSKGLHSGNGFILILALDLVFTGASSGYGVEVWVAF